MKVVCLMVGHRSRYKQVALAMADGIAARGDTAVVADLQRGVPRADVAVMYGWKLRAHLCRAPQWVYADLPYWLRDTHYRLAANDWSPAAYVWQGRSRDRLDSFGVKVAPWRATPGAYALLVGASAKSMSQHGHSYMTWEIAAARRLLAMGLSVRYRPKPTDPDRQPLPVKGVVTDWEQPLSAALADARCVVTHHSNVAVEALAAGVPAHCEIGAASATSFPLAEAAAPPRHPRREQFLFDLAWHQWSVPEMRSGAAWQFLRESGALR